MTTEKARNVVGEVSKGQSYDDESDTQMTKKNAETPKTTCGKLKKWMELQIKSYEEYPSKNDKDLGWRDGIQACLNKLGELDGRYK